MVKKIKLLLDNGADPNIDDGDGMNALYIYIFEKYEDISIDIVKELIKHGADPFLKDYTLNISTKNERLYDIVNVIDKFQHK